MGNAVSGRINIYLTLAWAVNAFLRRITIISVNLLPIDIINCVSC